MNENLNHKPLDREDRSFYGSLYRSLYDRLLRYGLTICHAETLVQDAIQELFESFMSSPERYAHIENIEAYLSTALRHSIYKKVSRQRRFRSTDALPDVLHEDNIEYRIIQSETDLIRVKQVRAAIAKLSAAESSVIKSRFFEDKSYDDIAVENNSSKRTVYNQIHSGIKKLRELF